MSEMIPCIPMRSRLPSFSDRPAHPTWLKQNAAAAQVSCLVSAIRKQGYEKLNRQAMRKKNVHINYNVNTKLISCNVGHVLDMIDGEGAIGPLSL